MKDTLSVRGLVAAFLLVAVHGFCLAKGPYQATGLKIGEVTHNSAIVWTRLTAKPERNRSDGPQVRIEYDMEREPAGRRELAVKGIYFPNGCTAADLREAVPGVDGNVRVLWKEESCDQWHDTAWQPVDPLADFTRQIALAGLKPATRYLIRVESRDVDGTAGTSLDGSFRTARVASDTGPTRFVVATCFGNDDQDCAEGFKIYASMSRLEPEFFVHTGDIIYYDMLAKTPELARYHWQRMYSWPSNVAFHRKTTSYFIKDDHDTWRNDCWPTMTSPYMHQFTFRQGQAIFREQVPMGDRTYRTIRWGKDVQIWLVEGRDFRSPNDARDGPSKTIWGNEQKQWFRDTVAASDATFRILISPTPIVGPDREQKADNHANAGFAYEGNELRKLIAAQRNMIVICGDRHWQYMSVDPTTGVREYSSGPASDVHAGGWKQDDYRADMHRFLRVAGGFLSVSVESGESEPRLVLRFHDVDGAVKFEDRPFEPAVGES
jgi:alkaline phosphatase D